MKRWLTMVLLCVLLLTSCGKNVDPFLTVPTDREETLVVYTLDREAYYHFINTPSFETLQTDHADGLALYTVPSDEENMIEQQYRYDGKNRTYRDEKGVMLLNNAFVFRDLITFGSSAQAIGAFLQQRDVTGEIAAYCVVKSDYFPAAIWVETTDGQFFITFNEYDEDYEVYTGDSWREDYVYRLYDHEIFMQKVLPTDGTVVVGDASVASTVIHTDYAEIPMIAVMKSLGATVKTRWNNRVEFVLEDQTVIVDHKKGLFNDEFFILPGGHGFCDYADGELLLDSGSAQRMLEVWGIGLDVDREQGVVRVTPKGR